MELSKAETIAEGILKSISPWCEIAEVAGSIRRRCDLVKDIEIVAVPRRENQKVAVNMFEEETKPVNVLYNQWATSCNVKWIQTGTNEIIPLKSVNPLGKYWRGLIDADGDKIKLDLFMCYPNNWGWMLAIRTGCSDFSKSMVVRANKLGVPSVDGFLTRDGKELATPTEPSAFAYLGLMYFEPEERDPNLAAQMYKWR